MNNLYPLLLLKPFRALLEKIILQRLAYLEKQRHCDPFLVEDLVKVLGRATHLLRQPYGCATLLRKFFLDYFPDVEFVWCCFAFHVACLFEHLVLQATKKAFPVCRLSLLKASGKAQV